MPKAGQHQARSRILRARIISYIEENGPATHIQLQAALGRSPSTIYHHTCMLAKAKQIHNEPIFNYQNRGDEAVWHLGEDLNASGDPEVKQRKVKVWPLHHFCDPLVAQFFGHVEVRV